MRPAPVGRDGLRDRGAAVVLVAHGSRDPRAAASTEALARAVAGAQPWWDVHASYLDHAGPRPLDVLAWLSAAGHRRAVLVPLLLTAAFHGRVDVPGAVAAARADGVRLTVDVTEVLGPRDRRVDRWLLQALRRRLTEPSAQSRAAGSSPGGGFDAVVLAAAGTRDPGARAGVDRVAGALGASLGVPGVAAYASAAAPDPGAAVGRLRAAGARRVGVAAYFLAPGLLYDAAMAVAAEAGAVACAAPLGDLPELAGGVLDRVDAARRTPGAIVYAA
jgi:sirohydrochlorin ferrochelatase